VLLLFLKLGDEKIKYAASLITTGRIIGAFVLLLTTPLSVLFFIVYALCCAVIL